MSWVARLAWLKREGVSESDQRVVECRAALAYYRIHKVIDDESGLSPAGVDRLVLELRGAVGDPDGTLCQSDRPRSPLTERAAR